MLTMIRFRCYYCRRAHTVEESVAGKRGRCVCGKAMQVPTLAEIAEADPAGELILARPPASTGTETSDAVDIDVAALAELGGESSHVEPEATDEGARAVAAPTERLTAPSPRRPAVPQKKRSRWLGNLLIALSVPCFAAWVYQVWLSEGVYRLPGGPGYFGLPRTFWSTAIFSLAIGTFLEGVYRRRPR
jgi:hypothetical protein